MKHRRLSMTVLISFCLAAVMLLCSCGQAADSTSSAVSSVETVSQNSEQAPAESTAESEVTEESSIGISDDSAKENAAEAAGDTSKDETEEYGTTLVVYFSHTGTTKGVAEYLHELVGGDIIELEPVNPYPEGYSDALDPAKQEQRENVRPEIKKHDRAF